MDRGWRGAAGARAWRWPVLGGLVVLALLLFHQTLPGLVARWTIDGGYAHGWLLLVVVGWTFLTRGPGWAARAGPPLRPAPAAIAALSLGWLAAVVTSVQVAEQFFLLLVLSLLPLVVFGPPGGLRMAGAVFLLVFALPVWDVLIEPLQAMTVAVTGICLRASGVPVLIEGNLVSIPPGQFRIVEGCSGHSYFIAGLALAGIWGFLWLRGWWRRLLLFAAAAAAAILGNWGRVYGVILAGYLSDMQHFLVTVDHYWFGWALFGIAMLPVFWLGVQLEHGGGAPDAPGDPGGAARLRPGPAIAAVLALLPAPLIAMATSPPADGTGRHAISLPAVPGWEGEPAISGDWSPRFANPDLVLEGAYAGESGKVEMALVYYRVQSQGRELVFYANRIADPRRWRTLRSGAVAGTPERRWFELEDAEGRRRRVEAWYEVGGRMAASGLEAKLRQLTAMLRGRRDGALIAVSAPCEPDCAAAKHRLRTFVQGLRTPLTRTGAEPGM